MSEEDLKEYYKSCVEALTHVNDLTGFEHVLRHTRKALLAYSSKYEVSTEAYPVLYDITSVIVNVGNSKKGLPTRDKIKAFQDSLLGVQVYFWDNNK